MTDGDILAIAVVVLAIGCWLWEHPTVAKGLGLVVLFGLVFCFGVAAHARTQDRRHHRTRAGQYHHRAGRYRKG